VAPVTELHVIRANRQVTLHPGAFLLASTVELVRLGPGLAAQLDGVSTNGRLGLMVHSTAGWVDPGFYGQLTLELSNVNPRWPIVLTPGMRIAQLCVFRCSSPAITPYRGRYQGQTGPWAARSK
jgi:dCTP deaminase